MNKKYHFPILKEKSTFVVQNAFFLLSTADNNFVTHFFLKKITNNNIHTLYRLSHMDPCSYEHCFWKQDTSLLTRRFRVTPYGISCINIEIIKGHIYVSFVMYLYHKNDMASKAAQHIQKNYCIFWQFQMIFFWQKQQCLPWIVSVLDEFSSA